MIYRFWPSGIDYDPSIYSKIDPEILFLVYQLKLKEMFLDEPMSATFIKMFCMIIAAPILSMVKTAANGKDKEELVWKFDETMIIFYDFIKLMTSYFNSCLLSKLKATREFCHHLLKNLIQEG